MPANIDVDALQLPYYDGAGNDFFIYDARILPTDVLFPDLARYVCDRHGTFGGADGLLVITPSNAAGADVQMRIFNADGSEPEMCGNGARCAVRYLLEAGGDRVILQTLAGLITGEIVSRKAPFTVSINIGAPYFRGEDLGIHSEILPKNDEVVDFAVRIDDRDWLCDGVSFGNPHIVIFVKDVELIDIVGIGPKLERAPIFHHGTNVHFAQVLDSRTLRVRHWERGAGATLACGTGTAAAAVAAIRRDLVTSPVRVLVPGGELGVRWSGGTVDLSGPATLHSVHGEV